MTKPFSPASARNRDPILHVLLRHFGDRRHVLEIGAGTGQHAVHFAAAMPWVQWQASDQPEHLPGMRQWLDEAALPNTPAPIALQAAAVPGAWLAPPPPLPTTPAGVSIGYDAVYSANTLHIMGWPQVQALFAGLPSILADDAVLAIYGPFNRNGQFTSDSNRAFDAMLRERDPASGLRDAEAVDALAAAVGLRLIDDAALPANNHCRVWRRG
ncbi:DUF938 domain-containing protein [Xanthomonas maliensis]|uniref:DUF938 domain-containing protein n=1 Tax=Xanthomonas maliensis TaxID=1321368 RepID=UPI0003A68F35|nr:DUF938 domain-containing protein [Xanthomonas maliensis]KAB7768870.1 DUF938 domain-containing protein [Xanthomonas maliensis]